MTDYWRIFSVAWLSLATYWILSEIRHHRRSARFFKEYRKIQEEFEVARDMQLSEDIGDDYN
jgi:hypothetical protein